MTHDFQRRVSRLEGTIATRDCLCGQRLVVFVGDPEPEQRTCPQHGRSRVIQWPLGRSGLDTGAAGEAIGRAPAMATVGEIHRAEDGVGQQRGAPGGSEGFRCGLARETSTTGQNPVEYFYSFENSMSLHENNFLSYKDINSLAQILHNDCCLSINDI